MRIWLASLFLLTSACNFFSSPTLSKKVVLDVNGRQMLADEFAQELAYRLKDQDVLSAKEPKYVATVKAKIVEEFLVQTLTEGWAKENGVVVKAEDLEDAIQKVKNSYPDDLSFQQALTDEGTTFKSWRERMQNTLLQKMVAKEVVKKVPPPTNDEIQAYYNENKGHFSIRETAQIRQVLVATESDAKSIEDELKRGKRMTDLAKKFSISPEAVEGGMVGWIEKDMSDIFESAFRMKTGQRSPVFKSDYGYHIFEVVGRKPARNRPLADVKDEIKSILMEKREKDLYLAWLEEQVRKARVFKDQAFIDALKVETKAQ